MDRVGFGRMGFGRAGFGRVGEVSGVSGVSEVRDPAPNVRCARPNSTQHRTVLARYSLPVVGGHGGEYMVRPWVRRRGICLIR